MMVSNFSAFFSHPSPFLFSAFQWMKIGNLSFVLFLLEKTKKSCPELKREKKFESIKGGKEKQRSWQFLQSYGGGRHFWDRSDRCPQSQQIQELGLLLQSQHQGGIPKCKQNHIGSVEKHFFQPQRAPFWVWDWILGYCTIVMNPHCVKLWGRGKRYLMGVKYGQKGGFYS